MGRIRKIAMVGAFVLAGALPSAAGDFTTYWQKDGDWESCAFFDPETEVQYYVAEQVRPEAPDHNLFSLRAKATECGRYTIGMYLYNTEKRSFSLTGEQGHFAMGTVDIPFQYDLVSTGRGFYRVKIYSVADPNLLADMSEAPIMAAHFPKVRIIREISLSGYPKALARAGELCRAGTF